MDDLFREKDDIGADSSLWLRPLRQLFTEGKPVSQCVMLTISPNQEKLLPFGVLSWTKKHRLLFWPAWPSGSNMICAGQEVDVFDHVTLEFPSEKIHVTAYDQHNKPLHITRAWKVHHFTNDEIALWFTFLVRISVLQKQDNIVQRLLKSPTSDKQRRTDEYVRFAKSLIMRNLNTPTIDEKRDYICCGFFLVPDSITANEIPPSILTSVFSIDSQIDGWKDEDIVQVALSKLTVEGRTICIAIACPSGKLLTDVSVGFPRKVNV